MTSKHTPRLLALAGLASLAAAPAFSQGSQEGGYYYGGLSVGQSRTNVDEQRVANTLLGQGLTTTGIVSDKRDTGYKLFLGYQMNRYLGVEAGYLDLGRFSFNATTAPAGSLDGKFRVRGANLDLVGTLPLTESLSALGRIGAAYTRTRDSFGGSGAVNVSNPNPSQREVNGKYGVGLQYAFTPGFQMRVEAERYRVSDALDQHARVNLYSVSLVFPFGRQPAPRAMSSAPAYVEPAPAPVVMAPAPPPAPIVVAVAPPPPVVVPERRRVSFSAESMFTFDRSDLRPEGKAALDTFAADLKGTRFETISVEGHTDRLGSQGYNQTLSQQRADAVKAYLVGTDGVDGAKISAVGKSESVPVTQAGDCKGSKPTAKLIACLQPDRRVEIEVVGTR